MLLSVLLYGCESWIVETTMESKINSFATSCYRVLLGISRLDRVPNEDILATVGRRPLIISVRRRQLGWLGHVLRRDEKEPAKIFALYTLEHGKAKQGQPPNTYLKQIASLLHGHHGDITPKNFIESATNKEEWYRRTDAFRRRQLIDWNSKMIVPIFNFFLFLIQTLSISIYRYIYYY